MLDGIWQVYKPDGTYLGLFETRTGNDVLLVSQKVANTLAIGDILHMDETHTKRAWEVRLTGYYRGRTTEFMLEKVADRPERYPERPVRIRITRYLWPWR